MAPGRFRLTAFPHPVVVILGLLLVVTLIVLAIWASELIHPFAILSALSYLGLVAKDWLARWRRVPASALARGPPVA